MTDKFRTPLKTRFVKTPNPTKSSRKYDDFTTPRKTPMHVHRNIEDEDYPAGFSKLDESKHWHTVKAVETDESTESEADRAGPSGISDSDISNPGELSIVAEFDELVSEYEYLIEDDDYDEYIASFVSAQLETYEELQNSVGECKRLQDELDKANHDIGDFSNKLNHARKLLDQEKKARRRAEEDRNNLEKQMALARDLLFNDQYKNRLPDETREKLAFLNNTTIRSSMDHGVGNYGSRLNTINEVNSNEMNSTGSLLSDLSYSRSEDDLDSSVIHAGRQWIKHRPAPVIEEPSSKKRRSSSGKAVEINTSDKIIATTTVSVTKDGPITATSVIESVPQEPETQRNSGVHNRSRRESLKELHPQNTQEVLEKIWQTSPYAQNNNIERRCSIRQHTFVPKTVIRPDTCGPCNKRIRFGKIVIRCKDCRGVCHNECKDKMPLPCIPLINTPTQKGVIGTISDYAPTLSPMVPAIIVHCVNEVELRGLNEIGIYRIPGSEKDVKMLREKFLRGKGAPMLNEVDIHVLCGVIKDFLRSLQEPIITQALWREFISVSDLRDISDVPPILYGAISKLPQPNRDTLAYMMLHLQKVSESKDCKMPIGNLAKVFGPTLIGYSSQEPDPSVMLMETRQQAVVMEYLLSLPGDFWNTYVNICTPIKTGTLHQTPSTDSLLRQNGNKGFFFTTPYGARSVQSGRKQKRFFGTPPYK